LREDCRAVRIVLAVAFALVALGVGATTTKSWIPTATCDNAIEIPDEPAPPPDTLVLGRVEMPRADEVLELGRPTYRGGAGFAKRGFSVTAGSPVLLEVPRRYRRVYGLAAGRARLGAPALRLRPCSGGAKPWTSWAGGYLALKPVCVWIVVRADGRSERVPLNIGRTCERVSGDGGNHGNG
jgi:hypothetical protein